MATNSLVDSKKVILSLVIASLPHSLPNLRRCLSSVSALSCAKQIQVILVSSTNLKEELFIHLKELLGSFLLVTMQPEGIYAAYNLGIGRATGDYIMFLGEDDILLPGISSLLSDLKTLPISPDIVASASYFELINKVDNAPRFRWQIVIRNIVHQSLLYNRNIFCLIQYSALYNIQADYFLNIRLLSNNSLKYKTYPYLISFFSSGGKSSIMPDVQFRRDLPSIMLSSFGVIAYAYVKIRSFLADLLFGSPNDRFSSSNRLIEPED